MNSPLLVPVRPLVHRAQTKESSCIKENNAGSPITGCPRCGYVSSSRHHAERNQTPKDPLLYVPSHAARDLDKDLKRAGIPKTTREGKIDFHACRVAYITHLIETGADVKTVQTLARHSDPRITLAVYAKARPERLADAAEAVGKAVLVRDSCS